MSWLPLARGQKIDYHEGEWLSARRNGHRMNPENLPSKNTLFSCENIPLTESGRKWYENRKLEASKVPEGSRKRSHRQQLVGYPHCTMLKHYNNLDLSPDSKRKYIDEKSFWRFKKTPPKTPDNYWQVDFPTTPQCLERGYMNDGLGFAPYYKTECGKFAMKYVATVYPDGHVEYKNVEVEKWALARDPPYTKEYIAGLYTVVDGKLVGLRPGDPPLKLKSTSAICRNENEEKIKKILKFDRI